MLRGSALLTLCAVVDAHSRLACPPARSPETGIKTGPCGTANDDGSDYFASNDALTIQPGPFTIRWQESIAHAGAPWRIALSGEASDLDDVCVLVDHIPHSPQSSPQYSDESTWTEYSLTIEIPDVSCEKCSIHLANPMTDKIGDAQHASGIGCCDPGSDDCSDSTAPEQCFSVYHSCSIPIRITGSTPRSQYQCPGQPSDWPSQWNGTSTTGAVTLVDASTPGVYRQESSIWQGGQLMTVPSRYRTTDVGCGDDTASDASLATNGVLSLIAATAALGATLF